MNQQIKTILLTVLTLSCFVIALVELSGISTTALFNKYKIDLGNHKSHTPSPPADPKMDMLKAMNKTTMEIDTVHDFGVVTEGEIVKHSFHFKNTGSYPLLIAKAIAGCGCTTPEWPKEPVKPGEEGDIVVGFNTSGRTGIQRKNVIIYSNAQQEAISIGFTAEVKKK